MMDLFSIYASVILVSAFLLVFYAFYYVIRSDRSDIVWDAGILFVGVSLFYLFAAQPEYTLAFAFIFILSEIQVHYYGMRTDRFLASFIILATVLVVFLLLGFIPLHYCLAAIAFGISGPFFYRTMRYPISHKKVYKGVEINRDFIQIAVGVLLVLILMYMKFEYAVFAALALVMSSYLFNGTLSTLEDSRMRRILSAIEKPGVIYGQGALFISMGFILFLGIFRAANLAIFFVIALYFADAVATIAGLLIRGPKLPYNKRKSIVGMLGFFAVASLGYFLIGPNAFAFAAILAIIESLPFDNRLDDNIILSIAFIVLSYVLIAG